MAAGDVYGRLYMQCGARRVRDGDVARAAASVTTRQTSETCFFLSVRRKHESPALGQPWPHIVTL